MVKHIVLFKFKPFASNEEKMAKLNEIKSALENLISSVKELKSIEIGINENPNEQFDLSLTSTHANMADLQAYAIHPNHVAVAKNMIKPNLESRSCVDYSF